MDLRNNQITIGELLANPAARQVLARRFPHVIDRPIVAKSGSMTVEVLCCEQCGKLEFYDPEIPGRS